MPLSWDQVTQSDAYQQLSPEDKDVARHQYFNNVVAPQAPPDQLHDAWQQFADYSRPSVVGDVAKSFGRGIVQGVESAPTAMADLGNTVALGEKKAYEYYRDISGNPLTRQQEQAIEANQPFYSSTQIQDAAGVPRMKAQPSTSAGEVSEFAGNIVGGAAGNYGIAKAGQAALNNPALKSFAADESSGTPPSGPGGGSPKIITPQTKEILQSRGVDPDSMTPKQVADAKNNLYASGISDNIQNAQKVKSGIYSMADEVGNTHSFDGTAIKNQLNALYQKFSTDPAYDSTPLVRRLASWKDMFEPDGSITPTRLNNIVDQVQDAYRESPKAPEGEVYGAISQPMNTALSQAKTQFPNWGKLIDTADDAHYNIMKSTRDDGTFTGKWSPESQKDFSADPSNIMGDTQRQINNLTNVKDEAELQRVMSFIPENLQGQYLQDVATNSSSPSNIKNLAKGVYYTAKGDFGNALAKFVNGMPSKSEIADWDPDATTHISDRISQWKSDANDAYQAHMDLQQAKAGMAARTQADIQNAQRTLPAPQGPAGLLPSPTPGGPTAPYVAPKDGLPYATGWSGRDMRQMTPDEYTSAQTGQKNWPAVAPGEAQPPAAYNDPRVPSTGPGNWYSNFMRENKARPLSSTVGQDYIPPDQKRTLQGIAGNPDEEAEQQLQDLINQGKYARGGKIPTEAQKEAGNYLKHHVNIHGLRISIETAKGEKRTGKDKDGKPWSVIMPNHYGYIRGTEGADKEHVDVYLGPNPKSKRVYIIDQKHLHNGKFDEHKVMLGYPDKDSAVRAYTNAFSDGKGAQRILKVTRKTVAEFKEWLKTDTTKPAHKKAA